MRFNPDRGCFVCPYCQTEWVPAPNFEGVRVIEPVDLKCPVCHTNLSQARLLAYGLLYCTACEGMVIKVDDLMALSEDLRASRDFPSYAGRAPDPRDLDRQLDCPMCGLEMEAHHYGGPGNIDIDTCEPCQIHWLDHGELRKIAMAPDHHYSA